MLAEYKIKNKTHPTQCPGNHLAKYIGLISCVSWGKSTETKQD